MRASKLSAWTVFGAVLSVVLALSISAVPMGVGAEALSWPNLTLCVVFFWLVNFPAVMPILAVLFIGLAHDLIGGGIPGAGLLALLLASLIVSALGNALARAALGPRVLAFIGFAAIAILVEWALTGLPRGTAPPGRTAIAQFLVTVLAYAPVSLLFRKLFGTGRT